MNCDQLEETISRAESLYTFVMVATDNMHRQRDFDGTILSMVEIHTLSMIVRFPGISVSEVADKWNRTVGAVSRNVDKLCRRGYVEKKKLPDNQKTIHLYATDQGVKLAQRHQEHDRAEIAGMMEQKLQAHSETDLNTFWSVLDTLRRIIQEDSRC